MVLWLLLLLSDDAVSRARALAEAGQRAAAITALEQHLAGHPSNSDARVLYGLVLSWEKRYAEARRELKQVLAREPDHPDALAALRNVDKWAGRTQRAWEADLRHTVEVFTDSRDPWQESQLSLKRDFSAGPLLGRFSHARRFGLDSSQLEADYYPRFRRGTYAYLNGGFSPDGKLYPRYRAGADLFQSLGAGWEGSGGYRRLGFPARVNILTGALGKYYKDWLFTGRFYLTASSHALQLSARRYFGEGHSYWGLRYGHGAGLAEARSAADLAVLDSRSLHGELQHVFRTHWNVNARAGFSREDRTERSGLTRVLVEGGLAYRF